MPRKQDPEAAQGARTPSGRYTFARSEADGRGATEAASKAAGFTSVALFAKALVMQAVGVKSHPALAGVGPIAAPPPAASAASESVPKPETSGDWPATVEDLAALLKTFGQELERLPSPDHADAARQTAERGQRLTRRLSKDVKTLVGEFHGLKVRTAKRLAASTRRVAETQDEVESLRVNFVTAFAALLAVLGKLKPDEADAWAAKAFGLPMPPTPPKPKGS